MAFGMEVRGLFKVGDLVYYGATGVCKIYDVTVKNFGNDSIEYFVLRPIYDAKSTLFVPKDNSSLTQRIQPVLMPAEILEMIEDNGDAEEVHIKEDKQRQERYKQLVAVGNRRQLARIVKILTRQKSEMNAIGKKMRMADERILKEGEKLLYDELSISFKIERGQVIPFLMGELTPELIG